MPRLGPAWPIDRPTWSNRLVCICEQAAGDGEEPMEDGGEDAADGSDEDSAREESTAEDDEMEELGGGFSMVCLHMI